jgi:hypothetical protein
MFKPDPPGLERVVTVQYYAISQIQIDVKDISVLPKVKNNEKKLP